MFHVRSFAVALLAILAVCPLAAAEKDAKPKGEDDYYRLVTIPVPPEVNLEVGGLEWVADGKLAICTRRGDIYLLEGALADPPKPKFNLFASGLHEPLGLAARDGWLYVTQRCDISRLKDTDGDGRADLFEVYNDGWEITGDYHEYAMGSKFDREGNLWVVLCLTGSFTSNCKYRGWCLRVGPDGQTIPTTSGVRSPGGIGANVNGDMFFTENQGPWNGACSLKYLKPGGFVGHPGGFNWYDIAKEQMGPKPKEPKSGSRMAAEAAMIPELVPTAVYFPYPKMGQSAAGVLADETGGKFGPFAGQMFVGDQSHSTVMRVFLEQVDGVYQGACFPFRQNLSCGCLRMIFGPDGSMLVGETNRGWGSRGPNPYGIERLIWTGETPFEIHQMRAAADGFTLSFTQPVDPKTAADVQSYKLSTYTYIYQSNYGSPEVDPTTPKITSATVAADGKSVKLAVDGLQIGHVHELHATGIRNAAGEPLLHDAAYYTLNKLPKN